MTDNIVQFPIQKEDLMDDKLNDQEMVFQLKLKAVDILNDVAAGSYTLSMKNIRGLLETNDLCREVGIPILDFDIDALTSGDIVHD